jgi:cathepsin D
MDGICGLAYDSISQNNNTPLVYSLKNAGTIDQAIVTFNLSHVDNESDMTIGGDMPDLRSGEYTFHDVIDKHYWMIKVDQVLVGDEVVVENMNGIVDTGTSLMVGNHDVVGSMGKLKVDPQCKGNEDLPDITFVISGKK